MNKTFYRQIYLNETDAAGVIYFANLLIICHQIYEESLRNFGINLNDLVKQTAIALPIVHSSSDFFKPLFWGDRLVIKMASKLINETEFELNYYIFKAESELKLAQAKTIHVAINIKTQKRTNLPEKILQWLKNS
jgi:1,4-dihydroxy-2-naphthoyl-CoA hydrolase